MPLFKVICTAEAVIEELWHVEAADAETAKQGIEQSSLDTGVSFIEQIGVDHEQNRQVSYVEEIVPEETVQPVALGQQVVLLSGNPVAGFTITGPFPHSEAVHAHLENHPVDDDWWIAPLVDPCDPDGG